MSQSTKTEFTSEKALMEKMYRLGYEDAKNKKEYGKSLQEESNTFNYQGKQMEQLTLF